MKNYKYQKVFALLTVITLLAIAMINSVSFNDIKRKCAASPSPLTRKDVENLSAEDIVNYFYWTNSSSCKLVHYFGGVIMSGETLRKIVGDGKSENLIRQLGYLPTGVDGQYSVCLDPVAVSPRSESCLVYSFGINNEWSFDDDMDIYGCQVYAFDPDMGRSSFNRTKNIHFYDVALSHVDDGVENFKLSTLYEKLKVFHGDALIDYLKIDIEYNEWPIIPQIVESGMLKKVKQLVMEVHLRLHPDIGFYRDSVKTLKMLEDAGMVRFDSKYCPWCAAEIPALNHSGFQCFQIAWYNSRYIYKP